MDFHIIINEKNIKVIRVPKNILLLIIDYCFYSVRGVNKYLHNLSNEYISYNRYILPEKYLYIAKIRDFPYKNNLYAYALNKEKPILDDYNTKIIYEYYFNESSCIYPAKMLNMAYEENNMERIKKLLSASQFVLELPIKDLIYNHGPHKIRLIGNAPYIAEPEDTIGILIWLHYYRPYDVPAFLKVSNVIPANKIKMLYKLGNEHRYYNYYNLETAEFNKLSFKGACISSYFKNIEHFYKIFKGLDIDILKNTHRSIFPQIYSKFGETAFKQVLEYSKTIDFTCGISYTAYKFLEKKKLISYNNIKDIQYSSDIEIIKCKEMLF